jgi:hypothetical protein
MKLFFILYSVFLLAFCVSCLVIAFFYFNQNWQYCLFAITYFPYSAFFRTTFAAEHKQRKFKFTFPFAYLTNRNFCSVSVRTYRDLLAWKPSLETSDIWVSLYRNFHVRPVSITHLAEPGFYIPCWVGKEVCPSSFTSRWHFCWWIVRGREWLRSPCLLLLRRSCNQVGYRLATCPSHALNFGLISSDVVLKRKRPLTQSLIVDDYDNNQSVCWTVLAQRGS